LFHFEAAGRLGRCLPEPGDPQRCCTRGRWPLTGWTVKWGKMARPISSAASPAPPRWSLRAQLPTNTQAITWSLLSILGSRRLQTKWGSPSTKLAMRARRPTHTLNHRGRVRPRRGHGSRPSVRTQ